MHGVGLYFVIVCLLVHVLDDGKLHYFALFRHARVCRLSVGLYYVLDDGIKLYIILLYSVMRVQTICMSTMTK